MTIKFDEQRTFGVEIEINEITNEGRQFDREELKTRLEQKGLKAAVTSYVQNAPSGYWEVTTDSSAGSGSGAMGYEVVSPILQGRKGLEDLEKVCDTLNEMDARVNVRCGLHVHHDISDLGVEQIKEAYSLYMKYEDGIDSIMPPSRRGMEGGNGYCQSLKNYSLKELKECETKDDLLRLFSSRYIKLNFQSYRSIGTLEFRQHSGTTNYEKISNWIKLSQLFVTNAKKKKKARVPKEIDYNCDSYRLMKIALKTRKYGGADEEIVSMSKFFDKRRKELAG